MKVEQVGFNTIRYRVELYEPYTVHIRVSVGGKILPAGVIKSENPCDKEASYFLNGQRPEWYALHLTMLGGVEQDTIFIN